MDGHGSSQIVPGLTSVADAADAASHEPALEGRKQEMGVGCLIIGCSPTTHQPLGAEQELVPGAERLIGWSPASAGPRLSVVTVPRLCRGAASHTEG
ncbi:hypothetical protein NDU88_006901 [Pleurodeles waltl]|uniref:Uncharacterized protein n=1 Tax=Pleurodeles waltl TaxID=8319 RepID=A0AAV7RQS9_PLEWA|nr:hypothetical protein NDU88_006901 [Pleurodeles waltl]